MSHDLQPHAGAEKLVRMANQIGRFFASQSESARVPGIADHIRKFWEPRMRTQILAHLEAGGAGLDPLVKQGLETLRQDAR